MGSNPSSSRRERFSAKNRVRLAHLARTGWFTPVNIHSSASERVRVLIGTHERLIRMRKDLEAHVRGVLKVFGICMGVVGQAGMRQRFRDQLAEAGQTDLAISVMGLS